MVFAVQLIACHTQEKPAVFRPLTQGAIAASNLFRCSLDHKEIT